MIVLVCGDRNWADKKRIFRRLAMLPEEFLAPSRRLKSKADDRRVDCLGCKALATAYELGERMET